MEDVFLSSLALTGCTSAALLCWAYVQRVGHRIVKVYENQTALLFRRGRLLGQVDEGSHQVSGRAPVDVVRFDTRPRVLEVEPLTIRVRDCGKLRLGVEAVYQLVDPREYYLAAISQPDIELAQLIGLAIERLIIGACRESFEKTAATGFSDFRIRVETAADEIGLEILDLDLSVDWLELDGALTSQKVYHLPRALAS